VSLALSQMAATFYSHHFEHIELLRLLIEPGKE